MIPLVYFYSSDPKIPNFEKTNRLKKSLSEILSRFYPLAGSLVNNLYVDCNDSGILFAEAVANCNLSEVIINPDLNKIRKSLFYKLDESQFFFLAVQATYFRCGGLAVGILLSHKMGDGYSLVTFANIWSAAARNGGDDNLPSPKFDCAAYFPPGDIASPADRCTEDLVDKTFTFPAAKIALLQDMYSAAAGRRWRPGRVETLSAYISTRLVLAMGLQADPTKTYLLNMAANLRSRIKAPMLKYQFGNFGWNAVARPRAGDSGVEVAQKLREAKKAFLGGYVPQLKDFSKMSNKPDKGERVVSFYISSVCGFPIYEADFGWGKPVWVVVPGLPVNNLALFLDTKRGDGIEVIMTMSKHDMEKFEVELEVPMFQSNL